MFCKNCGKEMEEGTTFCPNCGAAQSNDSPQPNAYASPATHPMDAKSGGFAFLCFLFPVVGLILYLVWKDSMPLRASSCGKGAIVGVIVGFVFGILYGIIIALAVGSQVSATTMLFLC